MNAIIMAGGEGTRLRSIWEKSPKPMIPLLGKPVMERTLALLRRNGVTRVRAALRYMPGVITEYFGDGSAFGVDLSYSVESEPLGTAGGVRACADFYGERDFLVLSGDAACDFDLRALMESECKREGIELYLPRPDLCGDNAAMIGAQGYYEYLAGNVAKSDLNAYATMPVDAPTF